MEDTRDGSAEAAINVLGDNSPMNTIWESSSQDSYMEGNILSTGLFIPYKNGRGKRYTFETTEHINGLLVEREMLTTLPWSSIRGLAQMTSLASSNECQSCK